jgi:hypothetical protein
VGDSAPIYDDKSEVRAELDPMAAEWQRYDAGRRRATEQRFARAWSTCRQRPVVPRRPFRRPDHPRDVDTAGCRHPVGDNPDPDRMVPEAAG